MLERASTCLESGGRQLFRAPKPALRSRRKLHSTFWHHAASDLSLPLWWAINPATAAAAAAEQPGASSTDAAPLDFLYPEKTLALLRKLSVRSDGAAEARRQQWRTATRSYATVRRVDTGGEAPENLAAAKDAKREMHERLMASSAHESLKDLLRRAEPGKQELAWQLYNAMPGQPPDADLLLPLLSYLTADNHPAVPTRIIKLFDQLPAVDRTAASYRAVIIAYITLRNVGPAINLHASAAKGERFVQYQGHVPDIGTDVILRRLVADEQWDLAFHVYCTYVKETRFSIDRHRTTYRIRWGQATLPEIWHDAAKLPEIKEHMQSLFVWVRQHKAEFTSTPKQKELFITFVQSFLPHVMDRVLHVRKPDEDDIWNWFTKLFDDLQAMELPVDASYRYAITAMLSMDRYREYTNQRKLHLELYRRYRQWYLYERVDDPGWKQMPPQLPLLASVLNSHGNHSSLQRVGDLVHDIRTFYPDQPLPQNILQLLLMIYAEHGDLEGVNKYLAESQKCYGEVTPKLANNLLYAQARRADVPGALAAFDRIRDEFGLTPDTQMWNTLLLTYVRADDLDGALETFNRALDAGVQPNVLTFGPMLDMCANRGDIEAFETLFSRAKQMGVPLDKDVRARSGYVQAYLNAEDVDGAEQIAQGMLQHWKAGALTGHPLTHTWNIMIQYYALRGDVANSRRLYREMVENKIPLDNVTFASLMRSLVEIKQTNAAYKILRVTLPDNNMRVEAIHYAIVMTGFLKEGQYDLALKAYERMVERNVTPTISSRQAAINTIGMSELVRLLKAKNSNPRKHLKHVEGLLRSMLTSGDVGQDIAHRQPNHNRYLDAHTTSMVPASYYGLLITLYNTRGAYQICKELFTKAEATMQPDDFDAPTTFLTAVMEAHYRAKEWDEVQKCWDQILASSSKLIKTFQQIMNPAPEPPESASLTDGTVLRRFEESRIALNRRQVITKATRIYIRSLINRRSPKSKAEANSSSPDSTAAILGATPPTPRALLTKAQLTIRDLLLHGFVVDNFTWNEFIVALAASGQLVAAFSIAETYLMPRFPGWRSLAPFFVRRDRRGYQWMELRHYDIKRNSVLPRYKTLVVLAKAMAVVKEDERNGVGYVEREGKWAREVLEHTAPRVCRAVETMPRTGDAMQERYFGPADAADGVL
ncbi:translation regulator [Stagonosporopsis vannaccii]|nr:translation regulator [Stagonosporopsis vannaccii]